MKNLINFNITKKKILLRVDLNVPVFNGKIIDKSRIESIKPTIKKLQENKNIIFLISHFGRPNGKKNKKYSLNFICSILEKELKVNKIYFLNSLETPKIQKALNKMNPGDICLFENIRFYPEEEKNDLNFVKELSGNFDLYINDAFSASHRHHASIIGAPKFLPSYAGMSFVKEIENINAFLDKPKKPNLSIIGGSKVSTKIELLNNLIKYFDTIILGGAMANTFLRAKKFDIGNSLYEKDFLKNAINIIEMARDFNCKIVLPIDVVCANNLSDKSSIRECDIKNILSNQMILDIGSKSTQLITKYIINSRMILWNGPLGAFEHKPFEQSSVEVAKIIKKYSTSLGISSMAGGGDTISTIKIAKAEDGFSYISNAGGAFLEWLEGSESPGFRALKEN